MKTVLYLIQAKAELPAIYQVLRKRNFLLLSYKTKTSDTTIFAPNTTWTEGRNLLYEYVKKHNLIYDYYVFMDEDVIFVPTSQITTSYYLYHITLRLLTYIMKILFPLLQVFKLQERGFDSLEVSFELDYPIVILVNVPLIRKKRPLMYTKLTNTKLTKILNIHPYGKLKWYHQTLQWFDPTLMSVSKKAFFDNTVLPYTASYDDIYIGVSIYIFMLKANYFYYNKILRNNTYQVLNSEHKVNYAHSNFTKELQLEIYKSLCKEFGVNDIQGSEHKEVPSPPHIYKKLKQSKILCYIKDIILISLIPILIIRLKILKIMREIKIYFRKEKNN